MFDNVVVGLKPDADPSAILALAVRVCAPAARLHLVSLLPVRQDEDHIAGMRTVTAFLERAAGPLRSQGFTVEVRTGVVPINAGQGLSDHAAEVDADLIVIGLTKRSRVGKALLGSDAQTALMTAPCPVLASRG
jgi:nucleotide-binding universal stress UspA family protein